MTMASRFMAPDNLTTLENVIKPQPKNPGHWPTLCLSHIEPPLHIHISIPFLHFYLFFALAAFFKSIFHSEQHDWSLASSVQSNPQKTVTRSLYGPRRGIPCIYLTCALLYSTFRILSLTTEIHKGTLNQNFTFRLEPYLVSRY